MEREDESVLTSLTVTEDTFATTDIKFIFCDFLKSNDIIICHRTGKCINVLVPEEYKDFFEILSLIRSKLEEDLS